MKTTLERLADAVDELGDCEHQFANYTTTRDEGWFDNCYVAAGSPVMRCAKCEVMIIGAYEDEEKTDRVLLVVPPEAVIAETLH